MAVILSGGSLVGTTAAPSFLAGLTPSQYAPVLGDYAMIYKSQPAVRTVVEFLARNVAELGIHLFSRGPEDSRDRVRDHPLVALLARPNPWTTRYRAFEALMSDLALYGNAYWWRRPQASGELAVVRIPARLVTPRGNALGGAQSYLVNLPGSSQVLEPAELVHFRLYHPDSDVAGLSPMETLAGILGESLASSDYRANFWRNAARAEGVLSRPADAPPWSATARSRFKAEFEALYTGASNSGRTAILEEGMTFTQNSFSAKDSQYLEARKLTREEVAAAFHIPLPMVGILDNATFSNITEQHKNLYQDTLGPFLKAITEELELQLFPGFAGLDAHYLEFNLAEKLRGSFEEQANQLRTSVGAPWLTRNEARARANLPRIDGGDDLITPLNVTTDPDGTAPASADVATTV